MQFARREPETFLFSRDRFEKHFQAKEFVDERAAMPRQHNCLILFSQVLHREGNRDLVILTTESQLSVTRDQRSVHSGWSYMPLQPITARPITRNPHRGVDNAL